MIDIINPIQEKHLPILRNNFEKKVFYFETNLFYEEQIPNVAYLLLEGKIAVGKKNKVLKYIEGKNLIGVKNLYQKLPTKFFASIMPNSTVLIIDRTTLFKVVNNKMGFYNFLFT